MEKTRKKLHDQENATWRAIDKHARDVEKEQIEKLHAQKRRRSLAAAKMLADDETACTAAEAASAASAGAISSPADSAMEVETPTPGAATDVASSWAAEDGGPDVAGAAAAEVDEEAGH
jgi:hypothetical protein